MLSLVMTLCLVGDPHRCRDYNLTIADEDVSMLSCMMISQQVIAKWATEHPGVVENWVIKKWKCEFNTGKDI
jgi:hypothetical protein